MPEDEGVNANGPRQMTAPKGVTKQGLLQTLGPGLITLSGRQKFLVWAAAIALFATLGSLRPC